MVDETIRVSCVEIFLMLQGICCIPSYCICKHAQTWFTHWVFLFLLFLTKKECTSCTSNLSIKVINICNRVCKTLWPQQFMNKGCSGLETFVYYMYTFLLIKMITTRLFIEEPQYIILEKLKVVSNMMHDRALTKTQAFLLSKCTRCWSKSLFRQNHVSLSCTRCNMDLYHLYI